MFRRAFNTQYDRKEQGIVADYVVIMGYDEYYAGSPEAGPVSSYNYVKEGITETLKEVPAEKVISGIPFFTRLWKETPKTEEELYGMDNAQAHRLNRPGLRRHGIRRPDRIMQHGKQTDQNMRSGWKMPNPSNQNLNSCRSISLQVPLSGLWDRKARISGI